MLYEARGGPFISYADLKRAFNEARDANMRYLAVITSGFSEKTTGMQCEDTLLRQLRYDGLHPDNIQKFALVRIFDLAQDFDMQRNMKGSETLSLHLSVAAQQAYARYLLELEAKKNPPLTQSGLITPSRGNRL